MLGKEIIEKFFITVPRDTFTRITNLPLHDVDRVLSGDVKAPIGHFIRVSDALGIPFDILPRASKKFITSEQAALRLQAKCMECGKLQSLPIYTSALEINQTTGTPSIPHSKKFPPVFCIKIDGQAAWYEEEEFDRFCAALG